MKKESPISPYSKIMRSKSTNGRPIDIPDRTENTCEWARSEKGPWPMNNCNTPKLVVSNSFLIVKKIDRSGSWPERIG